ncbi:MAG: DUF3450 domain-containing protein [Wenzhouxiangellaceae bacterium]
MDGQIRNIQTEDFTGMNKLTMKADCLLAIMLASSFVAFGFASQAHGQEVESALDASRQAAEGTRESQEDIDEIDSRIQDLLGDYRANLRQLEQLTRYNESQRRQAEAQRQEIESLTEDINNIASLQRAVQPLMQDMVDSLARVVDADIPFLVNERRSRVERLTDLMEDPTSSPAQRYRLLIEAYQIESEYGRTVESYRSDIETADRLYEDVDVLRIGRLVLIFKTDDDAVLKRYDVDSGNWVDLDKSFMPDVKTAMRVAREQIPPELLYIPVTAPETADEG